MSDITSGKNEALSNLRRAQISLQSLLMRQDIDHVDRLNWANVCLLTIISWLEKSDESH